MMDDMKLTPQEVQLKGEGDALLRQVAAMQPKAASPLLGPDGQPLDKESQIDPKAAVEKARKDYEEQQKKTVDELHRRLKELTDHDKEALDICSVILNCHRMIHWAKAELYGRCGAEDDLIAFTDRYMSRAAEGPQGFTLKKAITDMKHQCLPIAEHFRKLNEAQQGKRLNRLKRIGPYLDQHGIKLPTEQLRLRVGGCFRLGEVLVLHGEEEPVRTVLNRIADLQDADKVGTTYYLASDAKIESATDYDDRMIVMPRSWWEGAANHIRKLNSTLEPFVNNETSLLVVDDLLGLITTHQDIPVGYRKQVALVRLYQWARENAAAVVVGNIDTEEADPRFYGRIPYASVRQGVKVDGTPLPSIDGIPME